MTQGHRPDSLALLTPTKACNLLKPRSWTLHAAALAFCLLLLPLGAVTPQIRSTVLALTLVPWQQNLRLCLTAGACHGKPFMIYLGCPGNFGEVCVAHRGRQARIPVSS